MTETLPERPSNLRRAPKPAADETRDPIDTPDLAAPEKPVAEKKSAPSRRASEKKTPTAKAENAKVPVTAPIVEPAPKRRREETVQLASRVSPAVAELVAHVAAELGTTNRWVLETALQQYWGSRYPQQK